MDAICQTIVFYEQAYPEPLPRQRKWKEMAQKLGIEVLVDPVLDERRKAAELAKAHAEFMMD